ncbi:hypothetical protein PAAG_03461 [Paracoccidioides lutzii Pb01]|uniref:Uncharacterized protein n=1 Tax=Paracoccidioides lutzii (strain ATCC MYA-826 / Pb01) TaxID=502779 RepID=C1GX87_PARBA|nr:hypothetical protein PAAG_03461 [Paracoccidioides lutzii Pb01]EEH41175.2 hypothetical protein PAAG_03461 [Paracoccidioides lutzii Pb01]
MGPKRNPTNASTLYEQSSSSTSERDAEAPHTPTEEEIQAVEHERERLEKYKKLLDLQQQINTLRAEIQASESKQRETEPTDHTISANLAFCGHSASLSTPTKTNTLRTMMNAKSLKQPRISMPNFNKIGNNNYTNLKTPITWNEFYNWIHANIINPDNGHLDYELKYQELKQSEGQTLHGFVSTLQSVEGYLREKYSDYHRKIHLFNKILPSLRAEFERYAVKLNDLSYDAFITKLGIVESNILKTTISSSATMQKKSASRGNNSRGVAPTAPQNNSRKRKERSDTWCDVHQSTTHSNADCKAQKNKSFRNNSSTSKFPPKPSFKPNPKEIKKRNKKRVLLVNSGPNHVIYNLQSALHSQLNDFDGHQTRSFGTIKLAGEVSDNKGSTVRESHSFHIVKLSDYDMILEFPWLKQLNPLIDWKDGEFYLHKKLSNQKINLSAADAANELLTGVSGYVLTIVPSSTSPASGPFAGTSGLHAGGPQVSVPASGRAPEASTLLGYSPSPGSFETSTADDNLVIRLALSKSELAREQEKRRALELEIQLEPLRAAARTAAAANPPMAPPVRAWNVEFGAAFEHVLFDLDSDVGRAIAQFKRDTKSINKPNMLSGTANYLTWKSSIKSRLTLEAFPSEDLIFHIFYSALPTTWRNYVQKKIEKVQTSKSTAVILDVIPIMEEIRSRVGPSKNKKKDAPPSTQVNAANPSHSNARPGAYHGRDHGDRPTCPECKTSHHGICWLAHPDKALRSDRRITPIA